MSAQPIRPEPFRIEPRFVERIWGTRSLAPLFPEKTNLQEPIGEVWLTGVDCKVGSGPFAGKTLSEAWREMPLEWRGTRFPEPGDFPLLIKFLFPSDKLSIQVHPDDAYALLHEKAAGGRGKTEMWHILSADPAAQVLVGLNPGVTKESFLKALDDHTLEDLFRRHTVHAGDTYFVPARTPHTIGPGMVICEIQEYSDLTYRVYDYGRVDGQGRPRELHIQKALEVLDFVGGATGRLATHSVHLSGKNATEHLATCPYFSVDRWDLSSRFEVRRLPRAVFGLWVFVQGEGTVTWVTSSTDRESNGTFAYERGECWFIPPDLVVHDIQPKDKTGLLEALVPETSEAR